MATSSGRIHSFGAWARLPGSPNPIVTGAMPSTSEKTSTIGTVPPAPQTQTPAAPDLQDLLANASALVASLEAALERAKENERKLRGWLGN